MTSLPPGRNTRCASETARSRFAMHCVTVLPMRWCNSITMTTPSKAFCGLEDSVRRRIPS